MLVNVSLKEINLKKILFYFFRKPLPKQYTSKDWPSKKKEKKMKR
jgi:hypothetical protein